jgi:hypothetical protein
MKLEKEAEKVAQIFSNLGAQKKIAMQMAKQLLKRAEQRSKEEDISKEEALKALLEVTVYGAQGMLKPSDEANFEQKNR